MKKYTIILFVLVVCLTGCGKNPLLSVLNPAAVEVTDTTVVIPPPPEVTLDSVDITPKNQTITAGQTLQFATTAVWSDGKQYAISKAYDTSNHSVGTIDVNGLLSTTLSGGVMTVTVTVGSKSSSTTVTVTANPNVEKYQVVITGTSEGPVDVCMISYTGSEPYTRTTYYMYAAQSYVWTSTDLYVDKSVAGFHLDGVCNGQGVNIKVYRDNVKIADVNRNAGVQFSFNN